MKQLIILIGFLTTFVTVSAQDSTLTLPDFRNEYGFSFRSDVSFSYLQISNLGINNSDLPNFFPTTDELNDYENSPENYFSNTNVSFVYSRWSKYRGSNNRNKCGISFLIGTNDGTYFYDYWSTQARYTFDSTTSQSTGITYPVDSVYTSYYDRETKMQFLQLGLGGNFSHKISSKVDFQVGLKSFFDVKLYEKTRFTYSRAITIETYGQHYQPNRETATLQTEEKRKTRSTFFSMSISAPILLSYGFKYPSNESSAKKRMMEERQKKIRELKGRKRFDPTYSFRLGFEPVLYMVSLNNNWNIKPVLLYTYGIFIVF